MSEKSNAGPADSLIAQGALGKARLYTGDDDLVLHSFDTPLGTLAIATIACAEKAGPNEDSAALIPVGDHCLVLAIADGVGGMPAGRKASNLAIQALKSALRDVEGANVRTAILDAIESANRNLLELGAGSATTIIVAAIREGHVRTYHVGDSAAWLCGQRGSMKLQTTPHSPVGFAFHAGLLNENEALGHDQLHIISNVMGSNDMRIEIGPRFPLAARDTLLIASDGLFDNVLQDEIVEIIRKGPVGPAIAALWKLARQRMDGTDKDKPSKPDDFSAILFRPNR